MKTEKLTFEKVLKDADWIDKWEVCGKVIGAAKGEAIGEERKARTIAQNLVNMGIPIKTVVSATSLNPKTVKAMYAKNKDLGIFSSFLLFFPENVVSLYYMGIRFAVNNLIFDLLYADNKGKTSLSVY